MKLNFIQQGQPQGHPHGAAPAVILLHGLFGSLSNLTNTAKALCNDFSTYQLVNKAQFIFYNNKKWGPLRGHFFVIVENKLCFINELLKNVFEAGDARQNQARKRSL